MSLVNPEEKMSKSSDDPKSYIGLLDPPDTIRKKIRSAVTDSGREVKYDEANKPAISNLLVIYSLCSGQPIEEIEKKYSDSGYGEFKKDLAEIVMQTLEPIQKRFEELCKPGVIEEILQRGRERVEALAAPTLEDFRRKLGLVRR
jgi:tryptophanyl-tRNA synthetase